MEFPLRNYMGLRLGQGYGGFKTLAFFLFRRYLMFCPVRPFPALTSPRYQSDVLTNQVPVILFTILQTQGTFRANPQKFRNIWKPSTTLSFGPN